MTTATLLSLADSASEDTTRTETFSTIVETLPGGKSLPAPFQARDPYRELEPTERSVDYIEPLYVRGPQR